eukprot:g2903.t1
MEHLIPVITKLQDVFHAIGESPVDLPQIVVIGSQSSGKSSVLESIVGRDFLPCDSGICTRRPLVLQLQNTGPATKIGENVGKENVRPQKKSSGKTELSWGEFLHLRGQRFTDFKAIRQEIRRETERGAGRDRGINDMPIHLKINSPNVLDLTMVDLPGITKVAVGDQPEDIEERVRKMCLKYISNPRSIILAVSPANTDLANSESLKMARLVDPEGKRTLGVLTKLDLMDRGTDALDALSGRVIPLQLGYVGVVNRSQSDVMKGISIQEARKAESAYFAKHPSYHLMSSGLGTRYLTRRLNQTLVDHIKRCLPDIKMRISKMLMQVNSDIESIGSSTNAMDRAEQGRVLLSILAQFSAAFGDAIEGRSTTTQSMLTELYGGARISHIFNEIFAKSLLSLDPFTGLSDKDIRTAIRNATGPRPALFVPEVSFETLVRRQISGLTQAGTQCVEMVYEELRRLATHCDCAPLRQYQDLYSRVNDTVHSLLKQRLGPTQQMVGNLIKLELSYINTSHPDFIGGSRAVAKIMARMKLEEDALKSGKGVVKTSSSGEDTSSDRHLPLRRHHSAPIFEVSDLLARRQHELLRPPRTRGNLLSLPAIPRTLESGPIASKHERIEMEIIKSLVASYFGVVCKNFTDMVPKAIMCLLVNHVKDNIQSELVRNLYREDDFDELLKENGDVATRRKQAAEMRILLRKAMEIVNEVRDYSC